MKMYGRIVNCFDMNALHRIASQSHKSHLQNHVVEHIELQADEWIQKNGDRERAGERAMARWMKTGCKRVQSAFNFQIENCEY